MHPDCPDAVVPLRSVEELREEFRAAQRRRLLTRGVVWRDTELPEHGPVWADPPSPEKVD